MGNTANSEEITMDRRQFLTAVAQLVAVAGAGCSRANSKAAGKSAGEGSAVPPPERTSEKQLDYCLELQQQPSEPLRIKETRTFRDGERFRFRFRPGFDAYIYMLNRGPGENTWSVLFPNAKIEVKNPIHPGHAVTVPGETEWLRCDDRRGNEHLVLIAATSPLEEFAIASGRISKNDFEDRLASVERLYRPASSRRFEDDGWVKLFAAGPGTDLAIVLNLPLLHG
jgi:hypothetical protein